MIGFFRSIVVGTNGSDGAFRAMDWAAELAHQQGASVRVVHVLTYSHEFARDLSLDTTRVWRQDLEHELETEWVTPLLDRDVPYRALLVEDDNIASGLIKVADRERSDLIVVGTKAHGFAGGLRGSTGSALSHQARCPIVVVPPAWRSPARAESGQ